MRISTAVLAATLSVGALSSAAHAATTGSCSFKRTEFSASTTEQSTNSQSFTNLGDGGAITFTQHITGCVGGTFFGNVGNTANGDNVVLQVLFDGNLCAPLTTGDYVFANSDVDFSSHSVAFFCGAKVLPGSHTLQVQWGAGLGGTAEIFQHTLEVDHS